MEVHKVYYQEVVGSCEMSVWWERIRPDDDHYSGYHQNHPQHKVSQPLHRVLASTASSQFFSLGQHYMLAITLHSIGLRYHSLCL